MKSQKLISLLSIFLIIALGVFHFSDFIQDDPLGDNGAEVIFEDHRFQVEVADTPEERAEGLMFRESLNEDEGMLFVYEEEGNRSFWMKNTYIPLDIIFLDSNLKVINIEKANPEPNTSDENLKRYRSEKPTQYVLEINQNRSKEIGLEHGDRIDLRR